MKRVRPDVSDGSRERIRNLMLNVQVPLQHIVQWRILLDVVDAFRIEVGRANCYFILWELVRCQVGGVG